MRGAGRGGRRCAAGVTPDVPSLPLLTPHPGRALPRLASSSWLGTSPGPGRAPPAGRRTQSPRRGRRAGAMRSLGGCEHVCGPARVCAERRECARRAHPCVTCRGRAGQASAWCWVGLCKVAWVPTDDREAGPPPGSTSPALRCGALGSSWGDIRGPGLSFLSCGPAGLGR